MMTPLAQRLLSNNAYDIEFNGFLTNHVKHAIIALDKLQAPSSRVQEYWDTYTAVTPYDISIHPISTPWPQVIPATSKQFHEWKGQKQYFQEQVAFLQSELHGPTHNGNIDSLVQTYVPNLINGMVGALTHTIIHLGWGIDAQSSYMTIEGIAYLNFAHVGFNNNQLIWPSTSSTTTTTTTPPTPTMTTINPVMESFMNVADIWYRDELQTTWIEDSKSSFDPQTFHPELVPAGFQWEVSKVIAKPHPVATTIPSWVMTLPLDDVWEYLWRAITYIFLTTRDPNTKHSNFVVLHLLSSLWGLQQTLNIIKDETTTRNAIGHYYANVVVLLSASSKGFPTKQQLMEIQSEFPSERVDSSDLDWTSTVTAGIAEEEEHNIKLVYVCRELWNKYGYWTGFSEAAKSFTVTPIISSSSSSSSTKAGDSNTASAAFSA